MSAAQLQSAVADWVIERQVGTSEHADVFFARRRGVAAALKLARGGDPPRYLRSAREATALGRIDHPCVAPLVDAGCSTDGAPYVATRTLYRALCGEVPFTSARVLRGQLELVPPRRRVPELPLAVDDLCRWLLAPRLSERLPSATVLVATLQSMTPSRVR